MPGGPTPPFTEKTGALSAVGLAKETTYGTIATATNFVPSTGCTLETDPGLFAPEVMQGQRDKNIYAMYGQWKAAGAVDGPLFPSMGIPLFVGTIGTDAVTGAGPYVHTISQANVLPSFTVEKNVGGVQSQQYYGCRVNKYALKCAATNSAATFTADLMGQGASTLATPTAVTTVDELPYIFAEATISWGGNSIPVVSSLSMDIENGLKETYVLNGSHYLQFLTPITLAVTGQLDVVFDNFNDTIYGWYDTWMLSETPAALVLTFTHPSNAGTFKITLPSVRLSKIAIAPKMTDVVMETLSFEAFYSRASGYTIQAQVTNSVSTPY